MDQKLEPLSYARPMEKEYRPPMYCLILTVIVAGALIILGFAAFIAIAFGLVQSNGQMWALIPLCVSAGFFYIGTRSMRVAVRFLRGLPPVDENWDRWLFWIWITGM